jgi:nucleoside-diphosphate-sugar epimerase
MVPKTVEVLDESLSEPHRSVVELFQRRSGDIILLGAGGKMGPSLARMARRAADEAGVSRRVWAVSRFGDASIAEDLNSHGVEPISADLMDPNSWPKLPDAELVVFMVGCKFGTADRPGRTWVSNTLVPGYACQRYAKSRIAAFSSGNVYPMASPESGGCTEQTPLDPVGEYAMSVLGRERVFQHFAQENETPISLIRLNYAVEMRYGILVDIAQQLLAGQAVDRRTNWVNMIWQRDANAHALLALDLADSPAVPINVTGANIESVTDLTVAIGAHLDRPVMFTGEPQETALLNDASQAFSRFYRPEITTETLIDWTTQWLLADQPTWDRPTHFQVRSGKF